MAHAILALRRHHEDRLRIAPQMQAHPHVLQPKEEYMRRDRLVIVSVATSVIAWVVGRRFMQQSATIPPSVPDYSATSPASTSPSADLSQPAAYGSDVALVGGDRADITGPAAMSDAETALTEQSVVDAPGSVDGAAGALGAINADDAVVDDASGMNDAVGAVTVSPLEDVPGITTTDLVEQLTASAEVDQANAPPATMGDIGDTTTTASPDDLIVIEGIGPKISAIMIREGITTFAQLVETDVAQLSTMLRSAGITTANPTTWPQQAQLARDGQWDALKELQRRIKNGRLEG